MTCWELPKTAVIGQYEYRLNTDYRDILDIIERLNKRSRPEWTDLYVCMSLFYEEFEKMPASDYEEAIKTLFWFISCGQDTEDQSPAPKRMDWEQDSPLIISDINRVCGQDIRALPYLHWWTFISWFCGIGDGLLATVVSIRDKKRKGKKLEEWEREYYREHRNQIDFKTDYTSEEEELLQVWLGKRGD